MPVQSPNHQLDIRALPGTNERIAYKNGGLFPVLTLAPNGSVLAVLRGGAGHLGLAGRIEVIRSQDAGLTWTPPVVVADSDRDDRNPAFGVSAAGTIILSYHCQGNYDEAGHYLPAPQSDPRRVEVMVTRSHDGGLTWEKPFPLGLDSLRSGSPFGKIITLADGTLLMPVYSSGGSFLARSTDDGASWSTPSLIAATTNETALLVLPGGDILAVMRSATPDEQALYSSRSSDGGFTWSEPVRITGPRQHPGDLVRLANGDILLAYGNRNPPYRIEGLISRDGGQTWLDCLLTFSGHLYGYNVTAPRRTDLGYPSSVILREADSGRGVTIYYYNPSLGGPRPQVGSGHEDYYAIAVTWDEAALIAALDRLIDH